MTAARAIGRRYGMQFGGGVDIRRPIVGHESRAQLGDGARAIYLVGFACKS